MPGKCWFCAIFRARMAGNGLWAPPLWQRGARGVPELLVSAEQSIPGASRFRGSNVASRGVGGKLDPVRYRVYPTRIARPR